MLVAGGGVKVLGNWLLGGGHACIQGKVKLQLVKVNQGCVKAGVGVVLLTGQMMASGQA